MKSALGLPLLRCWLISKTLNRKEIFENHPDLTLDIIGTWVLHIKTSKTV